MEMNHHKGLFDKIAKFYGWFFWISILKVIQFASQVSWYIRLTENLKSIKSVILNTFVSRSINSVKDPSSVTMSGAESLWL